MALYGIQQFLWRTRSLSLIIYQNKVIILVVLGLILMTHNLILLNSMTRNNNDWYLDRKFAVVIDAGSSGSRVQIYSWKYPNTFSGSFHDKLPVIEKGDPLGNNWQLKVNPGISSFSSNMENLPSYIENLLYFALSVVPKQFHSDSPIYLYATAGMRLLTEDERRKILEKTCEIMKNSPLMLTDCDSQIKVISGEYEALYGWLSVNYLLKGFSPAGKSVESNTVGFLDMGGASAQIAFEPTPEVKKMHANDLFNITLQAVDGSTRDFHVFVTTFLGFGVNEARKRYLASLLDDKVDSSFIIEDPCMPKNLQNEYNYKEKNFLLKGLGDFHSCLLKVEPLLNKSASCIEDPCLVNGVHTPPIMLDQQNFVGISELWYTVQEVYGLGGDFDYKKVRDKSVELCSQNWSLIKEDMAEKKYTASEDRMKEQCFKAAWVLNFLHQGFGLPEQERRKGGYFSVDSINSFSVGWTLGVALLRAVKTIPDKFFSRVSGVQQGNPSMDEWLALLLSIGILSLAVVLSYFFKRWRASGVQSWMNSRKKPMFMNDRRDNSSV
jgi:Golgi apyrase